MSLTGGAVADDNPTDPDAAALFCLDVEEADVAVICYGLTRRSIKDLADQQHRARTEPMRQLGNVIDSQFNAHMLIDDRELLFGDSHQLHAEAEKAACCDGDCPPTRYSIDAFYRADLVAVARED